MAKLLQFTPSGLSYILFKQPPAAKYTTLEIPNRTGGTRAIKAPADAPKLVQRRLSLLLQDWEKMVSGTIWLCGKHNAEQPRPGKWFLTPFPTSYLP